MESSVDLDTLVSPTKKLLRCFLRSRDGWKGKCLAAKRELKLMGNQVRAVEKSRQAWRERCEAEEEANRALRQELETLKTALARPRRAAR